MKKKIAEFYNITVYAIDKNDSLILEYDTEINSIITFHISIWDGKIEEPILGDLNYILNTLKDWYDTFKEDLINMYQLGEYELLPDWEE